MIENNELYREKGNYNHPQPQGLVALRQYIFARLGEKRTLLMRFANESPFAVDVINVLLTELDSRGKVINVSKLSYHDVGLASGGTYTPPSAVVVSKECVDFRIKVVSVVSGMYRYTSRRGRLVAHYDRKNDKPQRKRARHGYTEVRSERRSGGRAFALVAAIAIILIGITVAMSRYSGRAPDRDGDAETGTYDSV